MTKVGLIKFMWLFFMASSVYGQKVKYKDIFALLSTKQYDQAEPFLRKYLADNDDNASAFLYMAMIFQEKALKVDILKETKLNIAYMDSSILFYNKAYKIIDDREVRKHDEYYQAYNRRDLRTGEFGVKLSDIQFDLEKKVEGLKERIDKLKMVKYYFTLSDSLYKISVALYQSFQQRYPGEQQLYLRADEKLISELTTLSLKADSSAKAFDHYKSSSIHLGKTGYNQNVTFIEINDYKTQGTSGADFFQDDLKLWDYKKFADNTKQKIEKEIFPLRDQLVNYDIEINKLRERLNADSVSVRVDLARLAEKMPDEQLKKIDPEPLPIAVFNMKTADLEYRSSILENKKFRDSTDVHFRLNLVNTEVKFLTKLDSVSTWLAAQDLNQKALDYNHFVTNTYNNTVVLSSYVKALKEYANREKRVKNAELSFRLEALKWLLDGADSIPLTMDYKSTKFTPLFIAEEKYTVGLQYKDSLSAEGYFYGITSTRTAKLKAKFPVEKTSFKKSKLPVTKALTFSDSGGQVYYVLIYSEQAIKEKYAATLAKIYSSDGLAWSNNYQLNFIPISITLNAATGELVIGNDAKQTVVDKNGKVINK
jgi:hypothetical protein